MMEVGLVGDKENCMEVDFMPKKDSENCRCRELEERSKSAEAKCVELERQNELLRRQIEELERGKFDFGNELKVSKRGNSELNQQARETTEGSVYLVKDENEDDIFLLMLEIRTLECEKKYAEEKCKELESYVKQLEKDIGVTGPLQAVVDNRNVDGGLSLPEHFLDGRISCDSVLEATGDSHAPGSRTGKPYIGTPYIMGEHGRLGSHCQLKLGKVRKRLEFTEDGKCSKKLAPSTPGVARPASSLINISDSDDEPELACKKMYPENGKLRTDSLLKETRESEAEVKDVTCPNSEDIEDSLEDQVPSSLIPRRGRKRVHKIVTSDSEPGNDDDDDLPISELFKSHLQKEHSDGANSKLHDGHVDPTLPGSEKSCNSSRIEKRRRLVRTREIQGSSTSPNDTSNYCRGIPDMEEIEDDSEEGSSENDDTNMDDFIVEDDFSEEEDVQDGDSSSERVDASEDSGAETDNALQNVSDDDDTYPEILSRFRRKKVDKSEWKFEADMLAAFAESPELCMRAVCALYRKQTAEEQASKETIFQNKRGFSQPDAWRGSTLAQFLLDKDPGNDLQKTVKELEAKYHGKGVKLCRKLARCYSKQLFDICKKKEDPYFHPPVIPVSEV